MTDRPLCPARAYADDRVVEIETRFSFLSGANKRVCTKL